MPSGALPCGSSMFAPCRHGGHGNPVEGNNVISTSNGDAGQFVALFSLKNRNANRMCCASWQLPAADFRDTRGHVLRQISLQQFGPFSAHLWPEVACITASSDANKLRSVTFGGRASGDRATEGDGSWFPPAVLLGAKARIWRWVVRVIGRTRHQVPEAGGRRDLGPPFRVAGRTARADWTLDGMGWADGAKICRRKGAGPAVNPGLLQFCQRMCVHPERVMQHRCRVVHASRPVDGGETQFRHRRPPEPAHPPIRLDPARIDCAAS